MKTAFINRFLVAIVALLVSSHVFAASDYLLEIEGVKGECKGQKFTLTENADGSFTVDNIPPGVYQLQYHAKAGKTGATKRTASETVSFEAIVSPRDAASGLPTGKRQHKPIVITKELDKSTSTHVAPSQVDVILLGVIEVGDPNKAPGDPIRGLDGNGARTSAPVKAGYDLKLNKKV